MGEYFNFSIVEQSENYVIIEVCESTFTLGNLEYIKEIYNLVYCGPISTEGCHIFRKTILGNV